MACRGAMDDAREEMRPCTWGSLVAPRWPSAATGWMDSSLSNMLIVRVRGVKQAYSFNSRSILGLNPPEDRRSSSRSTERSRYGNEGKVSHRTRGDVDGPREVIVDEVASTRERREIHRWEVRVALSRTCKGKK